VCGCIAAEILFESAVRIEMLLQVALHAVSLLEDCPKLSEALAASCPAWEPCATTIKALGGLG
jgi:hypothetical protein